MKTTRFLHCLAASFGTAGLVLTSGQAPAQEPEYDIQVSYTLHDATATPGSEFLLPFVLRSNVDVLSFAAVINFDESVLEATAVEQIYQTEHDVDWGYSWSTFDNEVGAIKASMVTSFTEYVVLPPNTNHVVLGFHFRAKPDAPVSVTEVRFEDFLEIPHTDPEMFNAVLVNPVSPDDPDYQTGIPTVEAAPVFINSRVGIVGDVSLFRRGNANGDTGINLTDAVTTLNFLFLGEGTLACLDAADANDDGQITITDPVATLSWLFLGARALPQPNGDPGTDPTPDALGCGPELTP
jgi:hypothetical protein